MIRTLLLVSLLASIAITGCSRKSDTHEPETTTKSETEVIEEVTVTEADEEANTTGDASSNSAAGSGDDTAGDSASGDPENPNSEGQLICNPEWFEWVNKEVMSQQGEAIAENYPTGLPEVGSDEWFTAMDKLTGGDGAHGPDGGSDEWCFMMQQRLGNTD